MATNSQTTWRWLRRAAALAACCAAPAWAGGVQDCPVLPFGELSVAQFASRLTGSCRPENAHLKVETPRARPIDPGPSLLRAEFSSLTSLRFASLLGSLKFDWAGLRDNAGNSLRTERTAVALGGYYRLDDNLALQTHLGMEHTGVARTRATVSSVWRPIKTGVLFAEWAGSDTGTESHRVGARWWVVPRRFAVEMGARYLPDGLGWVDRRIGVAFNLAM